MNSQLDATHLSPGRPSAEQSRAISGRILDASEQLFITRGYEAVSMDVVASQAHVSKRTLYERYAGKNVLLRAVIERAFERKIAQIDRIEIPTDSIPNGLAQLSDALVELVSEPRYVALHRILAAEQHRFLGLFENHSRQGMQHMTSVVAAFFERSLAKVDTRPIGTRATSEFFVSMVIAPSARRLVTDDAVSRKEFTRTAISIFLDGVRPTRHR